MSLKVFLNFVEEVCRRRRISIFRRSSPEYRHDQLSRSAGALLVNILGTL